MTDDPNVLMIFIEPTPYILGLIERLRERSYGEVRVLFVGANLTQQWGLDFENELTEVLPADRRAARKRIRTLLKSGAFQAVHLAGWGHRLLLSTIIFAWLKGIPSLVETDTPRPPYISRWKAIIKRLAYPLIFRLPTMFLPGGTRQAQYIRDFGVRDEKMTIAQMTVDTVSISSYVDSVGSDERKRIRERFEIPDGEVVFLYVGRMEPHKGVHVLARAFEQLRQVHSNAYLLLVGEGTMLADLQEAAQSSNGIKVAGIRVTGRLSGDELLDVYAASDVFVLPSLFEPWGLVVNEALAAGLGVIATDRVGCVDDLIEKHETGLVVDADSDAALLEAMQTVLVDPDLRESMKRKGRALIGNWSLENEAEIIVAAWRKTGCK